MKKYKYITISLNEEETKKATEQAQAQSRPLAQFLGLIISQHFNPTDRDHIAENLQIFRDGVLVNELTATGAAAALELVKVFICHYNDPKSTTIAGTINRDGCQEIKAAHCFAGAGAYYKYIYHFTGQACENLPRV